jgi:hypothetical protein
MAGGHHSSSWRHRWLGRQTAIPERQQGELVLDGAEQGVVSVGARVVSGWDARPGHDGGHVPTPADLAPEVGVDQLGLTSRRIAVLDIRRIPSIIPGIFFG